ncbi:hypothetical protein DFP72DRAFT_1075253 [Ephemerocybe angulata]|uniref:Uncharacterized protein n=1 Tax=Ephemerocybe angulata TaxID=980116 RepID=A0A8H6LYJ3_9AGAR|nr:hypothetical protein DFP72DRAFT_1075253 [Tulosesus angulatus]
MAPFLKFASHFIHHESVDYFSPNCARKVVVPADFTDLRDETHSPQFRIGWNTLKNPCCWTSASSWKAFIPLQLVQIYPFDCISPCLPLHYDSTNQTYGLHHNTVRSWDRLSSDLHDIFVKLAAKYSIPADPPDLPSTWGYNQGHRTPEQAHDSVSRSGVVYGLGQGYSLYTIQSSNLRRITQDDGTQRNMNLSSHPVHWKQYLREAGYTPGLVDGLAGPLRRDLRTLPFFFEAVCQCGILGQGESTQSSVSLGELSSDVCE